MFARKWQSDQLQRIIVGDRWKERYLPGASFLVAVYWDLVYHLTIRGMRGTLWNILPLLSSLWKFSWISSFLYALRYRDGDYTSQRRRIYDYNLRNGKLFSVILPCLDLIRGFDILQYFVDIGCSGTTWNLWELKLGSQLLSLKCFTVHMF